MIYLIKANLKVNELTQWNHLNAQLEAGTKYKLKVHDVTNARNTQVQCNEFQEIEMPLRTNI